MGHYLEKAKEFKPGEKVYIKRIIARYNINSDNETPEFFWIQKEPSKKDQKRAEFLGIITLPEPHRTLLEGSGKLSKVIGEDDHFAVVVSLRYNDGKQHIVLCPVDGFSRSTPEKLDLSFTKPYEIKSQKFFK